MGLLDLPAPILAWLDMNMLGLFGDALRLTIWAAIGAVISMFLYRRMSPQALITQIKSEISQKRRALLDFDGDIADAMPDIRRLLTLSLKNVGLALVPAVVASLPVLVLIVWLSNTYSFRTPAPGTPVEITAHRAEGNAGQSIYWQQSWPGPGERLLLVNPESGSQILIDGDAAAPVIHKRAWWNFLIGNPAGYLPDRDDLTSVEIKLEPKRIFAGLSDWLAGWEAIFFSTLIAFSVGLKFVLRIE